MDDVAAAEVTKALSHPLRLAYLRALDGRSELSPSEYAREVGEPLGNVSYHVKALFEAGVIEVSSMSGPRAGAAMALMELLAAA